MLWAEFPTSHRDGQIPVIVPNLASHDERGQTYWAQVHL